MSEPPCDDAPDAAQGICLSQVTLGDRRRQRLVPDHNIPSSTPAKYASPFLDRPQGTSAPVSATEATSIWPCQPMSSSALTSMDALARADAPALGVKLGEQLPPCVHGPSSPASDTSDESMGDDGLSQIALFYRAQHRLQDQHGEPGKHDRSSLPFSSRADGAEHHAAEHGPAAGPVSCLQPWADAAGKHEGLETGNAECVLGELDAGVKDKALDVLNLSQIPLGPRLRQCGPYNQHLDGMPGSAASAHGDVALSQVPLGPRMRRAKKLKASKPVDPGSAAQAQDGLVSRGASGPVAHLPAGNQAEIVARFDQEAKSAVQNTQHAPPTAEPTPPTQQGKGRHGEPMSMSPSAPAPHTAMEVISEQGTLGEPADSVDGFRIPDSVQGDPDQMNGSVILGAAHEGLHEETRESADAAAEPIRAPVRRFLTRMQPHFHGDPGPQQASAHPPKEASQELVFCPAPPEDDGADECTDGRLAEDISRPTPGCQPTQEEKAGCPAQDRQAALVAQVAPACGVDNRAEDHRLLGGKDQDDSPESQHVQMATASAGLGLQQAQGCDSRCMPVALPDKSSDATAHSEQGDDKGSPRLISAPADDKPQPTGPKANQPQSRSAESTDKASLEVSNAVMADRNSCADGKAGESFAGAPAPKPAKWRKATVEDIECSQQCSQPLVAPAEIAKVSCHAQRADHS